jgi:Transmembrane domain of unknown function (DUF3566)
VDHRVEPPAWLPQGAAPEGADPEADENTATEAAEQADDSSEAPAEAAAEEFSNGNGHDGSFTYSHDDSYHYGEDSPFSAGTSYRSPFTPHTPAGTSYASEEPAEVENGLAGSDVAGTADVPDVGAPGWDLPAGTLTEAEPASAAPPGSDLPASGLNDPAMPDTGFATAASGFATGGSGFYSPGTSYTDHGPEVGYTEHATYTDTAAPGYSDPAAVPYPAPEPLASAGSPASDPTTTAFSGPGTAAREQRATFGSSAAMATGIGAALRADKQRTTRFSGGEPAKSRPTGSQARKANLVISRIEPWSVMKFSFLISLVLWIVMFVAVALLYYALSSLGVFAALQRTLASVTSSQTSAGVDLTKWTSAPRILGYTMLLGAVDVVLITAISTVGAVIYNLVTHLGGGIEVTLKETE